MTFFSPEEEGNLKKSSMLTVITKVLFFLFVRMRWVILGAHSINEEEKGSKQVREVEELFPHPDYYHYLQGNDLMLIKVR